MWIKIHFGMHGHNYWWQQKKIKGYEILLCIILQSTICFAKFPKSKQLVVDDNCADYDSCKKPEYFRTCSCEEDCSRYGICCWDSPDKDRFPLQKFECFSKNVSKSVFIKQSCSPLYDGDDDIINSCYNNKEDWSDLMANVLVSSNKTWITYKNWNCAICNEEEVKDLWFWGVQASYPLDNLKRRLDWKTFRSSIVFNQTFERWGVYDDGRFIVSPVELFHPTHLHSQLRFCASNMISDCPVSWTDEYVKQQCQSKYGERRDRVLEIYFRNVYCALCNGLDIAELDCSGRNYNSFTSSKSSMAMKVIFNLNPWTGEHTDTYMDCASGLRYDPFLKICRSVTCGLKHPHQFPEQCGELFISNGSGILHDVHFIIYALFISYFLGYVLY